MSDKEKFYGKYRGSVINNVDVMHTGKIQAQVPAVSPIPLLSWATPCLPMAGIQSGMFCLPQIGAGVWIEFEGGDTDYPIWSGGYWGSAAEVPAMANLTQPPLQCFVVSTTAQTMFMMSDTPGPTGGFLLKTLTGAIISMNDIGITISNGKGAIITMIGPTVAINGVALVVT